jgi:hypothetical protein
MSEKFTLPLDFEWAGPNAIKHRVSGKTCELWKLTAINQGEVDYMVRKLRYDYRRDRLWAAVGRDIDRFRGCQIALRSRGYAF